MASDVIFTSRITQLGRCIHTRGSAYFTKHISRTLRITPHSSSGRVGSSTYTCQALLYICNYAPLSKTWAYPWGCSPACPGLSPASPVSLTSPSSPPAPKELSPKYPPQKTQNMEKYRRLPACTLDWTQISYTRKTRWDPVIPPIHEVQNHS